MYILVTSENLQTLMSCLFLHTPKASDIALAYGSKSVKEKVIHSVGVTMNFKNLPNLQTLIQVY